MAWRIAESLLQLRKQINAAYPDRDKRSDGGIGDAKHASRNSDHNPWLKDGHGVGVVTAIDIDEDLAPDIHSIEQIVKAIQKSKDPRVKYIIYEKRITVKGDITKWKAYHGANPHDHHAHISVNSDPKLYDSTKAWSLDLPKLSAANNPLTSGSPSTAENSAINAADDPVKVPTDGSPPSLVPVVTPVIEVPQISAMAQGEDPKSETKEEPLVKIGNKVSAVWTALGATVVAIGTFLTSTPLGIAISIIGAVALAGLVYMLINWRRSETKEARDHQAKLEREKQEATLKAERERQAFELQKLTLESAMRRDLNTVTISAPPPVELSNSDVATT